MVRLYMLFLATVLASTVAFAVPEQPGRIEGYDKVHPERPVVDEAFPVEQPVKLEERDEAKSDERNDEEDTRNFVETVMIVRLTEELHLDDEQTVVMVRRLRQLKEEISALRKARGDLYRQLKDAVRDEVAEADIQARLDALLEHDRRLEAFKQDQAKKLGEGLTTRQQAQLYIFLSEFETDMRHLVHRAQERSGDWRRRDGGWRGGGGDEVGRESVQDNQDDSKSGSTTLENAPE